MIIIMDTIMDTIMTIITGIIIATTIATIVIMITIIDINIASTAKMNIAFIALNHIHTIYHHHIYLLEIKRTNHIDNQPRPTSILHHTIQK
jgi:hypothetical protein